MERIGRYSVVRELGQGGQGRVYEAVLHGPGGFRRTVALKVLRGGDALEREARIGGWLRHENLVDVYEVGQADGVAFAAMEYCPDGTLADRAPLPGRAVVDVGLQVCAALQYAHDALGLVHLDLKPQNLLLHGTTVKVADLGIAQARGFADDGRIRGTRGYMAPEQARGAGVDARSDVYAMGMVLHELATGARPGASTTISIDGDFADSIVQTAVPRETSSTTALDDAVPAAVVSVDATCPGWLAPILARCLEPDPAGRYASMADLADALRDAEADGEDLGAFLGLAPRAEPPPTPSAERSFGREAEREALRDALSEPGIVTLKGPAGIGKSHLARAVAASWTEDPVWFAAVAEARSTTDVLRAVASAAGVALVSASAVTQAAQLGRVFADSGRALLVLDDLGSVDVGEVVSRWLLRASELRVLVTSRRALEIAREGVIEVGPLDRDSAVALVRACALERGVDADEDAALERLVERLDRVPLALELAAGRLGVLTTRDLLDRLDLSLLRSAEGPERHSTLRGALAWSWDQLAEAERRALTWLSVFRGGFTLEAAEAVLGAPDAPSGWALDVLDALMSHSLVAADGSRLRLLEPVRDFASERLVDPLPVEERHGRFFSRFGTDEAVDVQDSIGRIRAGNVEAEAGNLVVACERAIARGDAVAAASVVRAALKAVEACGPYELAARLGDDVLAMDALPLPWRIRTLLASGIAWRNAGRSDRAREHGEAAVRLAREIGEPKLGRALGNLASIAADQGRWDEVEALLAEGLELARTWRDRDLELTIRSGRANLARVRRRFDEARTEDELALAMARADGNRRMQGLLLGNLGNLDRAQGRPEDGVRKQEQSLALARELGDARMEALAIANRAAALYDLGRFEESLADLRSALRWYRRVGARRHEGSAVANIAVTLRELGRLDEARAGFVDAIAIHRETRAAGLEAEAWASLAILERAAGDYERARAAFAEARPLFAGAGNAAALAMVDADLASLEALSRAGGP